VDQQTSKLTRVAEIEPERLWRATRGWTPGGVAPLVDRERCFRARSARRGPGHRRGRNRRRHWQLTQPEPVDGNRTAAPTLTRSHDEFERGGPFELTRARRSPSELELALFDHDPAPLRVELDVLTPKPPDVVTAFVDELELPVVG
jgi:hypothetical protein